MAVTPAGSVALPIYLVRRMLALCATFQTLVGATTAAQAREHIFMKDTEGTERRPCAVITSQGTSFRLLAGGGQNQLRSSGTVFLWLAADSDPDDENNNVDGCLRFANIHGKIGDELAALSNVDQTADTTVPNSHLSITSMTDIAPNETPPELWDSYGRFWWSAWIIEWGDE